MYDRECIWEIFTRSNNLDFSRRGEHLIINDLIREKFESIYGSVLDQRLVVDLCKSCRACTPTITPTPRTIAIDRINYKYIPESQKPIIPFIEERTYQAIGAPSRGRITVVDDRLPFELAEWLSFQCFTAKGLKVNPDRDWSKISQIQLTKEVIKTRPQLMVCDKGLGYHDGLELITSVRENMPGLTTVLLTGEWDTSETHQVADYFLMKGGNSRVELGTILDRHFPIEV